MPLQGDAVELRSDGRLIGHHTHSNCLSRADLLSLKVTPRAASCRGTQARSSCSDPNPSSHPPSAKPFFSKASSAGFFPCSFFVSLCTNVIFLLTCSPNQAPVVSCGARCPSHPSTTTTPSSCAHSRRRWVVASGPRRDGAAGVSVLLEAAGCVCACRLVSRA